MRFAHLFETIPLNQLDNPAETRLHVGGKSFQLISNAGVEQLYDPRHCFYGIAFLQYGQVAMRWRSNPIYRSLSRPGDCRIGGATIDVDPLHRGDAFPDFKIGPRCGQNWAGHVSGRSSQSTTRSNADLS